MYITNICFTSINFIYIVTKLLLMSKSQVGVRQLNLAATVSRSYKYSNVFQTVDPMVGSVDTSPCNLHGSSTVKRIKFLDGSKFFSDLNHQYNSPLNGYQNGN